MQKRSQKYSNDLMLPASQATRATELGTLSVPLNAFYTRNKPQAYSRSGVVKFQLSGGMPPQKVFEH